MSYTLLPGTIPAKALAALALAYPDALTEAQLLDGIGQPDYNELPDVMSLAVSIGLVVRELQPGGWYWRATAEGVASHDAAQPEDAAADKRSPMQRMTQAVARKPPVASAKPEKVPQPAKANEAPPPVEAPAPTAPQAAPLPALTGEDLAGFIPLAVEGEACGHTGITGDLSEDDVRAIRAHGPMRGKLIAVRPLEHFDCALSVGGRLTIEKGDTKQTLTVEETRRLLRYLDRIRPEEETA